MTSKSMLFAIQPVKFNQELLYLENFLGILREGDKFY